MYYFMNHEGKRVLPARLRADGGKRGKKREKSLQKPKTWLLHSFPQDQSARRDAENQKDQEA